MVKRRSVTHLLLCKVAEAWLDDQLFRLSHVGNQGSDAGLVNWELRQGQVFRCLLHQFLRWHKAVPVFSRLAEQVEETSLVAHIRIGGNAQITGNGIGSDEPYAIDIS